MGKGLHLSHCRLRTWRTPSWEHSRSPLAPLPPRPIRQHTTRQAPSMLRPRQNGVDWHGHLQAITPEDLLLLLPPDGAPPPRPEPSGALEMHQRRTQSGTSAWSSCTSAMKRRALEEEGGGMVGRAMEATSGLVATSNLPSGSPLPSSPPGRHGCSWKRRVLPLPSSRSRSSRSPRLCCRCLRASRAARAAARVLSCAQRNKHHKLLPRRAWKPRKGLCGSAYTIPRRIRRLKGAGCSPSTLDFPHCSRGTGQDQTAQQSTGCQSHRHLTARSTRSSGLASDPWSRQDAAEVRRSPRMESTAG